MKDEIRMNKFQNLKLLLSNLVGVNYGKIMFATEMTDGEPGLLLVFSLKGKNIKKSIECNAKIITEIEKIWNHDKNETPDDLWSGVLLIFGDKDEKIKYFYHDPYNEDLLLKAEEWEEEYFPGMEFEPDDDEDNWWD